MIKVLSLEDDFWQFLQFWFVGFGMIVSEVGHRNHCIHLADHVHPFLHLHHVGILPFQKTAHQEEVAEHEGIGEEQTEEVAPSVVPLQYLFQLGE